MGATFKKNFNIPAMKLSLRAGLKKELEYALEEETGAIDERTAAGVTPTGGQFAQYAPTYGAWKKKKLGHGTVDLQLSGQMLGGMTSKVEFEGNNIIGKIFFSIAALALRAKKHIDGDGVPKRDFFKLSKQQIQRITTRLIKVRYNGR